MLRRLQSLLVIVSVCVVSLPALAATDEPDDDGASKDVPAKKDAPAPAKKGAKKKKAAEDAADAEDASDSADAKEAPATKEAPAAKEAATAKDAPDAAEPPPPPPATASAGGLTEGWHMELHGYFRAPMTLAVGARPDPDNPNGPRNNQISYGPNRVVDSNYYSFAYTRLQEQDWAELFIHAKKKHVDAAIGLMGYWFQGVGFRNFDAAWAPALAYLTLDTDVDVGSVKPNVAFTMGAFWPKYGYFEKYDTYTLGRFRQMGEELNITIPFSEDVSAVLTEGFGTGRDGKFDNTVQPPIYGAITSLDLLTWENIKLSYRKNFDLGLHYNTEWTAEPNLSPDSTPSPVSYGEFKKAHLTVIGAEINARAPVAGHLWLSPSYVHVRNGFALANGGTEVLHSLGGDGVARNFLMYNHDPPNSTGSGSVTSVGFMYENSLSNLQGQELGKVMPDVSLSVFGLLTRASTQLPATSNYPLDPANGAAATGKLNSLKYGADVTLQATTWFGFMLRYDLVNMDMDHAGYIFSTVTPRMIFSSHFLSSERIYLQYSRYTYGDHMKLAGLWPWGQPIVQGSTVLQASPYGGTTPDKNVLKLQAEIAF